MTLKDLLYAAELRWQRLSLLHRFAVTSIPGIVIVMLIMGAWVAGRVEVAVVESAAATAALRADTHIGPLARKFAIAGVWQPSFDDELDRQIFPHRQDSWIVEFRLWQGDTIIYSNRRDLIGKSFPPTQRRRDAWQGKVSAVYDKLDQAEHVPEDLARTSLLEIYVPVRSADTARVVALAETYQLVPTLADDINRARRATWLFVGGLTLCMVGLQLIVVGKGSRTINRQRDALDRRIAELNSLLEVNTALRQSADRANERLNEVNESYLRKLGTELHDGPLQLVGISLLRLSLLQETLSDLDTEWAIENASELAATREVLNEAQIKLRHLSLGLALPDLEELSVMAAIEATISQHERRTGTQVERRLVPLPETLPETVKVCLLRFIQEALYNAFRHAEGKGQTVWTGLQEATAFIAVSDAGHGMPPSRLADDLGGQGLKGVRARIDAAGGEVSISSSRLGTRIEARFVLTSAAQETVNA